MTEVVIVRHAQSVWNAAGRWQGWADPPLSELGERQAVAAGALLRTVSPGPHRFASSDLQRARRTVELLRGAQDPGPSREAQGPHGITERPPGPIDRQPGDDLDRPVIIDPDLRELDAGEWTGLRRDEIARRWPGQLQAWASGALRVPPGGEDGDRFVARLLAALARLHEAVPDGSVVVVSHGRAIHSLATALGGKGGRIEHLSGWRMRLADGPHLLTPVSLLDESLTGGVAPTPPSRPGADRPPPGQRDGQAL